MPITYDLYTEADIAQNHRKRGIFFTWYFILMGILLAAAIIGFVVRQQMVTMLITIIGGSLLIFLWDRAGSPVNRYARYLKDMKTGLQREDIVVFHHWGEISIRDGLYFLEFYVTCGEEERAYFLDARKPRPGLEEGDSITLVTHNKSVITITKHAGEGER